MNTLLARDKFRGCFVGAGIGDGLGRPVETNTREEILARNGPAGITGYVANQQQKIKGTMDLPPGAESDDTRLLFSAARSLIRCSKLDMTDQGRALVEEYDQRENFGGFSRGIEQTCQEIKLWFETGGKFGRSPTMPALPTGQAGLKFSENCGNGVAVRIGPLALFHAAELGIEPEPFISDAIRLGQMTHADWRASIAAIAVGSVIASVIQGEQHFPSVPDAKLKYCSPKYMEQLLQQSVAYRVITAEKKILTFHGGSELISNRLERMWRHLRSADELRTKVGTKGFALESAPFAIGTFLRHPAKFREGVLEAVNAGGDTDSNASLVGAMIGANVGLSNIPAEWVRGLLVRDEAIFLADELARVSGV